MNRKCEFLLHDVEFLSCVANIQNSYKYPSTELDRIWKLLLLNQFHDVLPGSSIGLVYKDSHRHYKDIEKSAQKLVDEALMSLLLGQKNDHKCTVVNTLGWERKEVVSLPPGEDCKSPVKKQAKQEIETVQIDSCGNSLDKISVNSHSRVRSVESNLLILILYMRPRDLFIVLDFELNILGLPTRRVLVDLQLFASTADKILVNVPSYGYSDLQPLECKYPAVIMKREDLFYFENQYLQACVDHYGRIIGLFVQGSERNLIDKDYYANQFVLYDDIPLFWDAWDIMDYHLETRKPLDHVLQHTIIQDEGPIRVSVEISDRSYLKQIISLDAECPYLKFSTETMVAWHENRKLLKVEFPTTIHTNNATYEIQYGHLQRPNHFNTSWDWARFEVCGHKWADISEYGYGVAILNDCKYGFSTLDGVMRMSLLRSPKAPDSKADMGTHHFTYAVMPHTATNNDDVLHDILHCLKYSESLIINLVLLKVGGCGRIVTINLVHVIECSIGLYWDSKGDKILNKACHCSRAYCNK
ncbi:hypothetical protein KUTeg_007913 [Tegillarca granosa]|uniref:Glycoside hydrolase family 38 central domain-containing protein n=1 Tax=Tegillarca granosa TaxID=220873 RepID=A0ABQ9FJ67_TEGGR|nr:hypothetical protein KUTeg_007913 [Tegillarca granosa]